jgi:hypothetical protein
MSLVMRDLFVSVMLGFGGVRRGCDAYGNKGANSGTPHQG